MIRCGPVPFPEAAALDSLRSILPAAYAPDPELALTFAGVSMPCPDPESVEARISGPLTAAGEAVSAVVLCGGQSVRMGTDKAALRVGEETLLSSVVRRLQEVVPVVRLGTGSQERYTELGLPVVLDRAPELGPLAGLEAALIDAPTPWVWLVACDLPRVSAQTGSALCAGAQPGDQVVQFGSEQQPEPLCALYHRSVLGAVRGALAAGRRRMTSFLDQDPCDLVRVRWLPRREDLQNVNHPEEWQRFLEDRHQGSGEGRA